MKLAVFAILLALCIGLSHQWVAAGGFGRPYGYGGGYGYRPYYGYGGGYGYRPYGYGYGYRPYYGYGYGREFYILISSSSH